MRRQGASSIIGALVLWAFATASRAADNPPVGASQAAIESPAPSEAKPAGPPDARTDDLRIAVVDLAKVFQDSHEFQKRQNELRVDIERATEEINAQKAEVRTREEKLAAMPADDPGYESLADEVATQSAHLQTGIARQKRQFANREARMYRDILVKCKQEIERWALSHNAALVVQISAWDGDESPDAMKRELAKLVLYHHGIEITARVTQCLNDPNDPAKVKTHTGPIDGKAPGGHDSPGIATFDLQRVFSVDAAFRRESEELQADVKEAEKSLEAEQARLTAREQALQQLDKNGDNLRGATNRGF